MEVLLGVPWRQLSPLHYMISLEASPGYNFPSGVWLINPIVSQLPVVSSMFSPGEENFLERSSP